MTAIIPGVRQQYNHQGKFYARTMTAEVGAAHVDAFQSFGSECRPCFLKGNVPRVTIRG